MTKPATVHELNEGAREAADAAPLVRKPSNVIEALAVIAGELPAIGKDGKADPKQGGYSYRGIEQITREAQRLFSRYGVVFVPRVVHHDIKPITVNDKPWTDTIELIEYDVYGPGGADDRITVGPILAIGRDNSDKGANKCMTQAFKYALLQTLCISDAKDDSDGQTHEADAPPPEGWGIDEAKAHVRKLAEGNADVAKAAWMAIYQTPWTADALTAAFEAWVNEPKDAPADVPGEPEAGEDAK